MTTIEVVLWGTAKRFCAGHRIRLIVAGSAYPRLARNFCDAEQTIEDDPLEVHPCTLEVHHADALPSALWLPVVPDDGVRQPVVRRTLSEAAARRHRPVRKASLELDAVLRKVQSDARMAHAVVSN